MEFPLILNAWAREKVFCVIDSSPTTEIYAIIGSFHLNHLNKFIQK